MQKENMKSMPELKYVSGFLQKKMLVKTFLLSLLSV